MDQGWIKAGDTRADGLEPFFLSEIAIGGLQGGAKEPQIAINWQNWAIGGPGDSKWLDQGVSRLDQGRGHPG